MKYKPINIKLLLSFLLLLISVQSNSKTANSSDINFDYFLQEDGLPNNQIQCIYQDKKGWMWIGTSQGLSRFDGYTFVNFLPNLNDSNSLRGNLVRVITEDKNGNLLIGTENGGLNIFNREKERFSHPYLNHKEFRMKEVSVNAIEEDNKGNIWLGTDFNIFVIDTAGELSAIHPKSTFSEIKLEGNFVRNLKFDRNGKLWIGTNNGVYIYTPSTNELETFNLPFGENTNREIWEIYLDETGDIWIGTYSSGAFPGESG